MQDHKGITELAHKGALNGNKDSPTNIIPKESEALNKDVVSLIRNTIAREATPEELQLFLYHSKRSGLDPLARQIYAVNRYDNRLNRNIMSIQVSIDGFRLIAERTGKYAGQIGPYWCGKDGKWKEVWLEDTFPYAAKIGIIRTDFNKPLWGVAKWNSYYPGDKQGFMWRKMPEVMLAKVAEALALRRSFPQELSGYYSTEEMQQANVVANGYGKEETVDIKEDDFRWFIGQVMPILADRYKAGKLKGNNVFLTFKSFVSGDIDRNRLMKAYPELAR